ncbi:MAG: SCO family protein [Phycisphaerales bacterium]|nr:MAG: SCO family protein [Phycisphaerales bacterium]
MNRLAHAIPTRLRPTRDALAWVACAVALAALALGAAPARGQVNMPQPPDDLLGIEVFEKRGERIPLDTILINDQGEEVRLGDFFDGKRPVLLSLVYFDCPMLCKLMLADKTAAIRGQRWDIGKDYIALAISFDHRNTTADAVRARTIYADRMERAGSTPEQIRDGWRFLLASKENAKIVADSVGFTYRYLPRSGEFSHPMVLMVLTPDGEVSNYLYGRYGVQFDERQLRLSLADAADGRLGTILERIAMWCYVYDPSAGAYTAQAMRIMQLGGGLTAAGLGTLIGVLFWTTRRHPGPRRVAATAADPSSHPDPATPAPSDPERG